MALVLKDRVKETTAVTGTGTATLLGAAVGYQSFSAVGNGNTTYYVIAGSVEWEVGIGTYTSSGTTLSRDTVLASSNAGSLVNFSAGTKDVWVDYAAGKAVTTDTLAYPPAIGGTTPAAGKFTTLEATGTSSLGTASAQYMQVVGDANYPALKAAGSGTNIPAVVQPKGTGALQAQQTDSTATGGNARGANAVDWQTSRNAATQVASGQFGFIGGGANNTAGSFASSVVGGTSNIARGNYSVVAGGNSNQADGNFNNTSSAVCGGYSNLANGFLNFVGGGYANSTNTTTAATTQSATMNGTTAVTLSGSNANIKVGQLITGTSINSFPNTYVAAISGTSLTLSQAASGSSTSTLSFFTPHGVVVGGGNNQATGSYSFIGGGGDAGTAANRNVASGDWSFVGGGVKNVASGIGSFIGGGGTDGFIGNTASNQNSAVVCGTSNTASGISALVANGYGNVASGNFSSVLGGAFGTTRSIVGNVVAPASTNPISTTAGTQQSALLILGVQTTDATATVLRSNTSAASTTNQVILPNNSAYYFRGTVVAGVTGGGNTAAWAFEGTIKRGANAASTTLVGTPVLNLISQDSGASTWVLALTADTTNGGLAVTFTGQASTTIRAVCKVETTEMTY